MPVANAAVTSIGSLPDWERGNLRSGMRSPGLRQVASGTKIFRVASQNATGADPEAGGWWFSQKAFNKIMEFAVQHDTTKGGLGFAIRRAMAVLYGWNDCDLLVEGRLKRSVKVFYGKGHKQREMAPNGMTVTFEGWSDLDQWYIPGLTERVDQPGRRQYTQLSDFGKSIIEVYRTCPIASYRWYTPNPV